MTTEHASWPNAARRRLRCAVQRPARCESEVESIETRLATVDRLAGAVRSFASHPAVVVAGVAAAIVLARTRGFRVLGNALVLLTGIRRLLRLLGPVLGGGPDAVRASSIPPGP
jgi:hypothetical protein